MLWSCQSGTLGPFLAGVRRQAALPFCSHVFPWLPEDRTLPTEPLPFTTESTSRPGFPYLQTSCVTINLSPWSPWWCRYQWPQRWEWCPLPWMSYLRHGGCQRWRRTTMKLRTETWEFLRVLPVSKSFQFLSLTSGPLLRSFFLLSEELQGMVLFCLGSQA